MRCALIITCLVVVGCHGPLGKPMVDRLDDETQMAVDEVWLKMFTPVDRMDRSLLLDVIVAGQLHTYGVDYLQLSSQKRVGDGLVVMDVGFDRDQPEFDEFSVRYVDGRGREVRRERFSRAEVEESFAFLFGQVQAALETEALTPEEVESRQAEWEARMEEIREVLAPLTEDDTADDEAGSD